MSVHVPCQRFVSPTRTVDGEQRVTERESARDMSEDRLADDQAEGIASAVGLPSDALTELV